PPSSCVSAHGTLPDLPSFPTRRSSDLRALFPATVLIAAGCSDFDALTRDELDRHPPRPERRFAASLGPPPAPAAGDWLLFRTHADRKSTRLNSSHASTSYAVFCLKKKT